MIAPHVSLYDDEIESIVRRSLVIHALANDQGRVRRLEGRMAADELLACGVIADSSGVESATAASPVESNLNVDGIDRPDLSADNLSLRSALPTDKGGRPPPRRR